MWLGEIGYVQWSGSHARAGCDRKSIPFIISKEKGRSVYPGLANLTVILSRLLYLLMSVGRDSLHKDNSH